MDEVTFLEMCRDSGFAHFKHRDSDVITISILGNEEQYKIIRVIEFTSDRKRMSVIAKHLETGRITNFIKGADMAILQRIDQSQQFEMQCVESMDDLALEGLRTLMFAIKEFPQDIDEQHLKQSDESQLENDLRLVGITALEDLLQEKCKETIRDLRKAKIKVWMLTGDKGETAQTIGVAAGLIDEDKHNILKIQSTSVEQLGSEID